MTGILEEQIEEARAADDPIGSRMRRVEDERLVRGLGRFVDDVHLPRLAHMAVVRCPYPRAHIAAIDVSAARRLEGVFQVLVPDDVLGRTGPITILRPIPDAPSVMP